MTTVFRATKSTFMIVPALATLLTSSCSKKPARVEVFPVAGSVVFEGKPTPGALVVLHPTTGNGDKKVSPVGYVAADGSFQIGTFDKADGAPPGHYLVTVQWLKRPPNREDDTTTLPNFLPAKYARPDSSKLEVEVIAGANQLERFSLKR